VALDGLPGRGGVWAERADSSTPRSARETGSTGQRLDWTTARDPDILINWI